MFCKICGTDIGESKFCPNCGASSSATSSVVSSHSAYYHQICDYARDVNSFFVFGLLSMLFCMGIGLIFEIICLIKGTAMQKTYQSILAKDFALPDHPDEWEKFRNAQAKHKSGSIMFAIGFGVTVLLLFILGCVAFVNAIS